MADSDYRPCVSAIIVVWNGERYLHEAIESVLAQTMSDWELIVVDDGSADGTTGIVEAHVEAQPHRIRLLTHPGHENRGIAASRNLGLAHARGRYIAFLDADDVWLPEKLEQQVGILEADRSLGLVYGRTLIWHSWIGEGARPDYYYPLGVPPNTRQEPPALLELLLENKAQTPTTCSAIMRSELFAAVGGFEERFRGLFEDVTFFAKALAVSPTYVADQTWSKYRRHDASCSARSRAAGAEEAARLAFLSWLAGAIQPLHPSARVRACIRRARVRAAIARASSALRRLRKLLARLRAAGRSGSARTGSRGEEVSGSPPST